MIIGLSTIVLIMMIVVIEVIKHLGEGEHTPRLCAYDLLLRVLLSCV